MTQTNKQRKRHLKRKRKYRTTRLFLSITAVVLAIIAVCVIWNVVFSETNTPPYPPSESQHNQTSYNPAENDDWNLTLVNKWNPIPNNWEIHLVEVEGGERVDKRIYEPLMGLLEAAKEENLGELPKVVSGYRTQEKQQELLDEKIAQFKQQGYSEEQAFEQANMWVSVPGYSEHQLGFAVDINGATYDVYIWLQENSYKYGFIFRYPGNKTDITGAAEEVWHYRYVGVEAAAEIYEQGVCLEEYLENRK